MKLVVISGEGLPVTIGVPGQAIAVDRSGVIADPAQPQKLMADNAERGGWLFQNLSTFGIWINDLGDDAGPDGGFLVGPGGMFPPDPYYPVSVTAISIKAEVPPDNVDPGEIRFTAREW